MPKIQITENYLCLVLFIYTYIKWNAIQKVNQCLIYFASWEREKKHLGSFYSIKNFFYVPNVGLNKSLDKPIHNSVEYFDKNDRSFIHMNFKFYHWHILPYSVNLSWWQFFFVYLKSGKIQNCILNFFMH